MPTADTMPMAASPYTRAFSLIFKIITELATTSGMETYIGENPKKSPRAMAPKLTCDNPSPMSDILRSTKKSPSTEQEIATNVPAKKAL